MTIDRCYLRWIRNLGALWLGIASLLGCEPNYPPLAPEAAVSTDYYYVIGPGDTVQIFVWGNPEVSTTVPVGPDGRITTPLVEDLEAVGKTSSQLARDIEQALSRYIKNPLVTVIVSGFVGPYSEQIRVVGEATEPKALPYQSGMTLLDLMIAVNGLTEFAAGNRASIVRVVDGQPRQFSVRLDDLIKDGDIEANVDLLPGDVLIIPEAIF